MSLRQIIPVDVHPCFWLHVRRIKRAAEIELTLRMRFEFLQWIAFAQAKYAKINRRLGQKEFGMPCQHRKLLFKLLIEVCR